MFSRWNWPKPIRYPARPCLKRGSSQGPKVASSARRPAGSKKLTTPPARTQAPSRPVVRAWSDRVEAFDYDAPVTGDAFPTHTVYGRYIIVAQPKER